MNLKVSHTQMNILIVLLVEGLTKHNSFTNYIVLVLFQLQLQINIIITIIIIIINIIFNIITIR